MSKKRIAYLEETVAVLVSRLIANSTPQERTMLSSFLEGYHEHKSDIQKEETLDLLHGKDDISRIWGMMDGHQSVIQDLNFYREDDTLPEDRDSAIISWLSLYFKADAYHHLKQVPYFKTLAKEIEDATRKWLETQTPAYESYDGTFYEVPIGTHDQVRFVNLGKKISYTVKLVFFFKSRMGYQEDYAPPTVSLVVEHNTPWFLEPVVHRHYHLVHVDNITFWIKNFIRNELGLDVSHLHGGMDATPVRKTTYTLEEFSARTRVVHWFDKHITVQDLSKTNYQSDIIITTPCKFEYPEYNYLLILLEETPDDEEPTV